MKQLTVQRNFKTEIRNFIPLSDEQLKEIFQVVDLQTVIIRSSFLKDLDETLSSAGWSMKTIQMGESVRFTDEDHMSYVTKKVIPVALRENGDVVLHDLGFHTLPIYFMIKEGHFELIDTLSSIMDQKGTHEEKMVDAGFFELFSAGFAGYRKTWFNLIDLDLLSNSSLNKVNVQENTKRFNKSKDAMFAVWNKQTQEKIAA